MPVFDRLLPLLLLPVALVLMHRFSRPLPAGKLRRLFLLRAVTVSLLGLVLAGPKALVERGGRATALLVDRSRSCQTDRTALAEAVKAMRAATRPDDAFTVLTFAGAVEAGAGGDGTPLPSEPAGRDRTDLGGAIRAATAFLDRDMSRRLVLLTDGEDTAGRLRDGLKGALMAGVRIFTVPAGARAKNDLIVRRLDLRERGRVDEPVPAVLDLFSPATGEAQVTVAVDGVPRFTLPLALRTGTRRYRLPLTFDRPGFTRVEVEVSAAFDSERRNNRAHGFIDVGDEARVLYVTAQPDPSAKRALERSGIRTRAVDPAFLTANAQELAGFAAVVLDNVPATALGDPALRALADAVRTGGVGLFAFGGDRAFGQGGYRGTPLESVLPVASDLLNDSLLRKVAVVFLLDRSGSMDGQTLEVAKAALFASGRALNEQDAVGIVAFDADAKLALPLTAGKKDGRVLESLLDIGSGGGTDFLPALGMAADLLERVKADYRHVILLSDGHSSGMDFDAALARFNGSGITLSTVAIGAGADEALMRSMSAKAGGRFYQSVDLTEVPRIFLGEVREFKRSYVEEGTWRFTPRAFSPALACLDPAAPFTGYVRTVPQPGAEIVATVGESSPSGTRDPLLAFRRVGAGRSGCLTADSGGRWSALHAAGTGWAEFVRLAVSSVFRDPESLSGKLAVTDTDEGVEVACAVPAAALRVRTPDGATFDKPFTADGMTRFVPEKAGVFLLTALAANGDPVARRGFVNPYSREYRRFGVNAQKLREIAAFTGGRTLDPDGLAAFMAAPDPGGRRTIDLATPLLLFASLLLLVEIFARRFGAAQFRRRDPASGPAEAPGPVRPAEPEDPMALLARKRKDRFIRIDK